MLSLSLSLFNFVHFTAAGSDNKKGEGSGAGRVARLRWCRRGRGDGWKGRGGSGRGLPNLPDQLHDQLHGDMPAISTEYEHAFPQPHP